MRTALMSLALTAGTASAAYDLQITEMWMGNEPGSNLTEDWIEITNFGDTAFTFGVDGDLYFDDDSFNWENADILAGIASIGAGESVVFVNGDAPIAIIEWTTVWGTIPGLQIGVHDGSGLGQGGDGVAIFLDAGLDGIDEFDAMLDSESYPDASANGGQSWDSVLGAFSTVGNASGAFGSLVGNDEGQFAIASPGLVPAPGAALALGLGGLGLVARRRR